MNTCSKLVSIREKKLGITKAQEQKEIDDFVSSKEDDEVIIYHNLDFVFVEKVKLPDGFEKKTDYETKKRNTELLKEKITLRMEEDIMEFIKTLRSKGFQSLVTCYNAGPNAKEIDNDPVESLIKLLLG